MESLNISSELIENEVMIKPVFGNMSFYNSGNVVYNKRGVGIIITTIFTLVTSSLTVFLM